MNEMQSRMKIAGVTYDFSTAPSGGSAMPINTRAAIPRVPCRPIQANTATTSARGLQTAGRHPVAVPSHARSGNQNLPAGVNSHYQLGAAVLSAVRSALGRRRQRLFDRDICKNFVGSQPGAVIVDRRRHHQFIDPPSPRRNVRGLDEPSRASRQTSSAACRRPALSRPASNRTRYHRSAAATGRGCRETGW